MTDYCGFDNWGPCQTWDQLAMTGVDGADPILLAIGALSLIGLGAMAIAWVNRQERERRFWRDEAYRAEGREYDGRQ